MFEDSSEVKLLDHGYLKLVDTWGSDEQIIEAARMSTGKGFLGWGQEEDCPSCYGTGKRPTFDYDCPKCSGKGRRIVIPGDEKLLRFLWDNAHATPFEMAGLTIEVKAPIMVFREWHRHRVPFGYNEMSARYIPLPDENYSPTVDRLLNRETGGNKQAMSTGKVLEEVDALAWLAALADVYEHAQKVYEMGISMGVPKELARLPVPVGRYSRMRATSNLRGWLGFLKLRAAKTAQYEIRVYAHAVADLIKGHFPQTHQVSSRALGI